MANYRRLPVAFERGAGAWLWDEQGNPYLDALSGIAVCALGHAHPAVSEALCKQASQLTHTSNLYGIPLQERLASRLTVLSGMQNAFFCNSGAEANEAAIKIARVYGHQKNISRPVVVVMEGGFHGRTLATLSATGNRKFQAGFEPLVAGFLPVPYSDLEALHELGNQCADVVAVLLEPIQGEGGIVVPSEGYLRGVRGLCDDRGWLMMLDEVQTGMCRTGRWFACQHAGILPDVMTLAKALGNGVPIGACLARGKGAEMLQPGTHGSTFGGNPLACRAALAVIETMERDELAMRAAELGERMLSRFRHVLRNVKGVKEIRGQGLMIGIELDRPCTNLVSMALERKLLINVTEGNVVRLLPPLIISDAEADQIVDVVSEVISIYLQGAHRGVQ